MREETLDRIAHLLAAEVGICGALFALAFPVFNAVDALLGGPAMQAQLGSGVPPAHPDPTGHPAWLLALWWAFGSVFVGLLTIGLVAVGAVLLAVGLAMVGLMAYALGQWIYEHADAALGGAHR